MDPEALAQLPPEYLAEYNGRPVLVASWVTIFVTAVFTALRIYGRAFLKKGRSRGGGMIGRKKMLEWDDVFMIAGTLFSILYCVFMILTFTYGGGYHFEAVFLKLKPRLDATKYMLMVFIAGPLFMIAMGFIKGSMCLLYIRLSRPSSLFRRLSILLLIFITLMTIGLALGVMLPCRPIDKFWNMMKPGKCYSLAPYYFAQSCLLIATDLAVCVLPIRMVWKIQLPVRQKLGLYGVFALGLLGCIAGAVKVSYLPILLKSKDTPYAGSPPLVWTFIELCVTTVAACGPSLKTLIVRVAPRVLGSSWGSGGGSRGAGSGVETVGSGKKDGRSLGSHYSRIHLKSLKGEDVNAMAGLDPRGVKSEAVARATEWEERDEEEGIPQEGGIVRTLEVRVEGMGTESTTTLTRAV